MKAIKKITAFIVSLCIIAPTFVAAEDTNVNNIYVPKGTCLDYYTDDDIKNTATNLFELLSPNSEDTKDIYTLYKNERYLDALVLFRNYMIDRVRAANLYDFYQNKGGYMWEKWNMHAEIIVGDKTLEECNKKWGTHLKDSTGYLNYMDPDVEMHLDWLNESGLSTNERLAIAPEYGGIFGRIATIYAMTKDVRYLKKFFQVMESYAMERRAQKDAPLEGMTEKEKEEYAKTIDATVYYPLKSGAAGQNLNYVQGNYDITGGLIMILKALPGEQEKYLEDKNVEERSNFYTDGVRLTQPLEEEVYDLVDPVRFGRMAYHMISAEFYRLSAYIINTKGIPNQQIEGLIMCFKYMCLFKDFTPCMQYVDREMQLMNEIVLGSCFMDGGVLEKSFNYNSGTIRQIEAVYDFSELAPEYRSQFGDFSRVNKNWQRLTEGYSSNVGLLPNIGNVSNVGAPAVWKDEDAHKKLEQSLIDRKTLKYTSVAYPYSGYVAMRDGWSIDDLYLGFYNTDYMSSGHHSPSVNAIEGLSAYGRTMLISGAGPWYGYSYASEYPKFIENGYDEINTYFQEYSSLKNSTIMVNNMSQNVKNYEINPSLKRLGDTPDEGLYVKRTPKGTLPFIWGSSTGFDYSEGLWRGGYTANDREKAIPRPLPEDDTQRIADHSRKIIFSKDAKLWFVFDEMTNQSGKENEYTQIWNFAAYEEGNQNLTGFQNEQVVLDNENKLVYTADNEGPNLYIKSITDQNIEYKKYYGYFEKGEAAIGWSKGGTKNTDLALCVPRADIHVKWKDGGILGDTTKITTILAPSKDNTNPIENFVDLSEGKDIHYQIKTTDGVECDYYSSPDYKTYNIGNTEIRAKLVVATKNGDNYKFMVMDCMYVTVNGVVTKYNTYNSFAFETDADNGIKNVLEFAVPDYFEWVENEAGNYVPVYNDEQKKSAQIMLDKYELQYYDIDNHWAKNAIEDLFKKGITEQELLYYPDRNITRSEFIAMVIKALGKEATEYKNDFTDLLITHQNSGYIQTAYDLGIISGYDNKIYPDDTLTREEMSKIIVDAFALEDKDCTMNFSDINEISDWAENFVKKAVSNNILCGYDRVLNPKGNLTRAEAAQVIYMLQ